MTTQILSNPFEIWKAIEGYGGRYEVSNFGRVRSLIDHNRKIRNPTLLLALQPTKDGYMRVKLSNRNKSKTIKVHRLVLIAFKGEPPPDTTGSHLDGAGSNNHIDNLIWETQAENNARRKDHGTMPIGERTRSNKLNAGDIPIVRALVSDGKSHRAVARQFSVSHTAISDIVRGHTWAHIPAEVSE
jgi:hypothetical protein